MKCKKEGKMRVSRAHSEHINPALLGLDKGGRGGEVRGGEIMRGSEAVRGSEVVRGSGSVDFHYSKHIAKHCRNYLG